MEKPSVMFPESQRPAANRILWSFELLFILVYLGDCAMAASFRGFPAFLWRSKWAALRLVCAGLILVDNLHFAAVGFASFRVSRVLRPMMLIARGRNLRKLMLACLHTLRAVWGIGLMTSFIVCFYALCGFLLFCNVSVKPNPFSSLRDSMFEVFMMPLYNGSNMFAMMQPFYAWSRWSALYFLSFYTLAILVVLKLLIGTSSKSYKLFAKSKLEHKMKNRLDGYRRAFVLLVCVAQGVSRPLSAADDRALSSHEVPQKLFDRLFAVLRPELANPREALFLLRKHVGVQSNGQLSFLSFAKLCGFANARFTSRAENIGWVAQHLPRVEASRAWGRRLLNARFRIMGQHMFYHRAIIIVLVSLSVAQLVATAQATEQSTFVRVLGPLFTACFTVEVALKIFCMGIHDFWADPFNRIDLVAVTGGLIFYCTFGLNDSGQSTDGSTVLTQNLAVFLRCLQLVRLLKLLPEVQKMMVTLALVMPSVGRVLFMLFVLEYAYAVVGVWLYAHKLRPDDPRLANTEWVKLWAIHNFDDVQNALLCLFQLSILPKWDQPMNAALLISEVPMGVTWLYFISFRVLLFLVFFPVSMGILLESFVKNHEQPKPSAASQAQPDQPEPQDRPSRTLRVPDGSPSESPRGDGVDKDDKDSAQTPLDVSLNDDDQRTPRSIAPAAALAQTPLSHSRSQALLQLLNRRRQLEIHVSDQETLESDIAVSALDLESPADEITELRNIQPSPQWAGEAHALFGREPSTSAQELRAVRQELMALRLQQKVAEQQRRLEIAALAE